MAFTFSFDRTVDDIKGVITISNAARLFGLWVLYQVLVALYNISPLHPLSRFPGPKLAAMTIAYEGYFDLIKVGRYSWEIKRMHEKYGPVVRVSPSELHFNDPSFIDEIYAAGGRKRNKTPHTLRSMTWPLSISGFGTEEHDLHRIRRAPMGRHFSRQQMIRLEPDIHRTLKKFCDKLIRYGESHPGPFDITMAYSCFTSDVISEYSFGEPMGLLDQDGWEPNWRQPMYAFLNTTFVFRFVPYVRNLAVIGNFFARKGWMGPDIKMLMDTLMVRIPKMIEKTRADAEAGIVREREAVYLDIFKSKALPESEKSMPRLSAEGMALMNAGTDTTGWALTVMTYHVLSRPEVLSRLTAELKGSGLDVDNLSWASLEKLPYISGVIHEGLRLSYGVSARSPRIAPDEDLVYRAEVKGEGKVEYVIPRGWAMGCSAAVMHHNEDVFPDSNTFLPERWFDEQGNKKKDLEKCLLSFSRGTRQCLGMK
ncbi:Trichodiene oxygenase [Cytospora mali]|uniref:Trichodiene oxygenase n=1 Tax=Cytospora mali TaxID=578113 RepID=A0A194UPT0_CYTMA|nr:Trichodiene oxygenase [Valsa mali var. pyri (nom. inval.)]